VARRVSLPSADDLFRPTEDETDQGATTTTEAAKATTARPSRAKRGTVHAVPDQPDEESETATGRRTSGRVRHDEKMTVYVTSEELLELEHARLTLRSAHGVAVDRGRLVREAIALVLADLEANADESALVRRLTEE
jgi:hypothetical protein